MPRPPILPTINWRAVFEQGMEWNDWIEQGESEENRRTMIEAKRTLAIEPHWEAMLGGLTRPVHVVAIAEDWCGDVVRNVPALVRLEDAAPQLLVRFITRETRPDVFARFLTNGGEAIPKFVFLSDKFVECGNWGPMPADCRLLIARGKAAGQGGEARKRVSGCYESDPLLRDVFKELLELIDIASTTHV